MPTEQATALPEAESCEVLDRSYDQGQRSERRRTARYNGGDVAQASAGSMQPENIRAIRSSRYDSKTLAGVCPPARSTHTVCERRSRYQPGDRHFTLFRWLGPGRAAPALSRGEHGGINVANLACGRRCGWVPAEAGAGCSNGKPLRLYARQRLLQRRIYRWIHADRRRVLVWNAVLLLTIAGIAVSVILPGADK